MEEFIEMLAFKGFNKGNFFLESSRVNGRNAKKDETSDKVITTNKTNVSHFMIVLEKLESGATLAIISESVFCNKQR